MGTVDFDHKWSRLDRFINRAADGTVQKRHTIRTLRPCRRQLDQQRRSLILKKRRILGPCSELEDLSNSDFPAFPSEGNKVATRFNQLPEDINFDP